jgi:flagellar basal body-associated protein FliL
MPEERDESLETEEIEEEAASGRASLLGKANIALVLMAVVFAECMAAYFFVPDPAETAAMVGATIPEEPKEQTDPLDQTEATLEEQVEVDLGEFHVTAYQPLSNSTFRLDFHLYGTVIKDDEEAFQLSFEENKNRFRDQAIRIFRSSEVTDLTDAKLGLIKRKILETSNKILGEPFLRTIIFSDYSLIEQ